MLSEKVNFTITVDEEEYVLDFTIRVLKNIFTFTKQNPFEFLSDFTSSKDIDDVKTYVTQLIICITNGELDVFDIAENVITDENIVALKYGLINLIQMELRSEIEEINEHDEEDDDENEVIENVEEDKIKSFIKWFNNMYYIALYQLNMSYKEFLDSTVRELKTLEQLHRNFNKDCLLSAYVDVMKSRNRADKKEIKKEKAVRATGKNGVRIKNLLMALNK